MYRDWDKSWATGGPRELSLAVVGRDEQKCESVTVLNRTCSSSCGASRCKRCAMGRELLTKASVINTKWKVLNQRGKAYVNYVHPWMQKVALILAL